MIGRSTLPVIVLACGDSKRFQESYKIPKQFLNFAAHPFESAQMWQNALNGFQEVHRTYVAVRKDHHLFLDPNGDVTPIWLPPTAGQADTALMAVEELRKVYQQFDDILLVNCDQGFAPGVLDALVRTGRREQLPAAITFRASADEASRWSYVNDHPTFDIAAEKAAIGSHALAGAYYFNDIDLLVHSLDRVVNHSFRNSLEPYISGVYDFMNRAKISVEVRRDDVYDWGTIEGFEQFTGIQ